MDLVDNRAIPVTDEQINAFTIWVKSRYGGKEEFQGQLRNQDRGIIENYFVHHIFSKELAIVFHKSEAHKNELNKDPDILQLQLYRRRLDIKISRTITDLITRAFPGGEDTKLVSDSLRLQRHTTQIRVEHYNHYRGKVSRYTVCMQAPKDGFPVACELCLSTHPFVYSCVTNCGHQFGAKCFRDWDYTTCPICSAFCKDVTEFIA